MLQGDRCVCPQNTAWDRTTQRCAEATAAKNCPQGQFYSKTKRRCVPPGRTCRAMACSTKFGQCHVQMYYENYPKDAVTAAKMRCNQIYGSCSYIRTCCKSGSGAIIARRVARRSYSFTSFACGSSAPDAAVPGLKRCGSRSRCIVGARWNFRLAGGSGSGSGTAGSEGTAGKAGKKKPGDGSGGEGDENASKKKKKKKKPVTEERKEAIAFCWSDKKNPDFSKKHWMCHGPVQKTSYTRETLTQKLYYVGCSKANWASKRYSHTSGDKRGFIFFCNKYQASYDDKIASKYGVPGSILGRRKIYICPQYSTGTNRCKVK